MDVERRDDRPRARRRRRARGGQRRHAVARVLRHGRLRVRPRRRFAGWLGVDVDGGLELDRAGRHAGHRGDRDGAARGVLRGSRDRRRPAQRLGLDGRADSGSLGDFLGPGPRGRRRRPRRGRHVVARCVHGQRPVGHDVDGHCAAARRSRAARRVDPDRRCRVRRARHAVDRDERRRLAVDVIAIDDSADVDVLTPAGDVSSSAASACTQIVTSLYHSACDTCITGGPCAWTWSPPAGTALGARPTARSSSRPRCAATSTTPASPSSRRA